MADQPETAANWHLGSQPDKPDALKAAMKRFRALAKLRIGTETVYREGGTVFFVAKVLRVTIEEDFVNVTLRILPLPGLADFTGPVLAPVPKTETGELTICCRWDYFVFDERHWTAIDGWNLYFDEPALRQLKIDAESLANLSPRERIRIVRSSFFKNMDRSRKEIADDIADDLTKPYQTSGQRPKEGSMGRYFSFPEVFPIVEKIILGHVRSSADYMTHDEIAAAFLADEAGCKLLDQLPTKHSREWWAHNIVAWFSQSKTISSPQNDSRFERKKIGGKWAYKVAAPEQNGLSEKGPAAAD